MICAILFNPGHSRVYFETSLRLAVSELAIIAGGLSENCAADNIRRETICGAEYLFFETENLSRDDLKILYGLSFVYAIFAAEKIGGEIYFKPLENAREPFIDESFGVILKYSGKTNEIFTRMMLNIAKSSLGNNHGALKILDPVAGKGTTLYEAFVMGHDAYGIEIADSVANEARHFVKKFFETAKYKFEFNEIRISGPDRTFSAKRYTFTAAKNKADVKNGEVRTLEIVAGNSVYADKIYKKNFFDIIAGDLPYGVQHGNVTKEKQSSLTRNPSELLSACLPSWSAVLKPGGVIILSWNTNVLPVNKMRELLTSAGFLIKNGGAYDNFAHRVDQSITRDLIIGVKKTP